ncbi:MAG: hypothetical protein ACI843_001317 [Psychrobacter glaciei]|jgi:hypothetical protein
MDKKKLSETDITSKLVMPKVHTDTERSFPKGTVIQHKYLALAQFLTIIRRNNTPPAIRKISALRGVNYFYSMIKGQHHAVL